MNLILDGVNLSNADISDKKFIGTSLRNANLDNVNFENADFSHCNLTGVHIEETPGVNSAAVPFSGDKIYANYDDGGIREWLIGREDSPHPRKLFEQWKGEKLRLFVLPDNSIGAFSDSWLYFYDLEKEALEQRAFFEMKPEQKILKMRDRVALVLNETDNENSVVNLVNLEEFSLVGSIDCLPSTLYDFAGFDAFLSYNAADGLKVMGINNENPTIEIKEARDVTCLAAYHLPGTRDYLIGWGDENGRTHISQLSIGPGAFNFRYLLLFECHEGKIKDMEFITEDRIVSIGFDQKLYYVQFDREIVEKKDTVLRREPLQLKIRCKGMKIDNLQSAKEYALFKKFIDRDSE